MKRRILFSIFCIIFGLMEMTAAHAATYYVATTGNNANAGTQAAPFQTIQKGIDTAASGDTVLVAAGTYIGDGNKNLSFAGKNFTLASLNGSAATIIDCQANRFNPARGFTFANGETNAAVLDGFTIQNGCANSSVNFLAGGGIAITGASPTIRNCVVRNNIASPPSNGETAVLGGGGISIDNGSPRLENCAITGNVVQSGYAELAFGGGIRCNSGNLTLTDCTLSDNRIEGSPVNVRGVGIYVANGSAIFTRCAINDNVENRSEDHTRGGGVYVASSATMTLTSCTLAYNRISCFLGQDTYGGGIYSAGTLTLTDCTLTGNQAVGGFGTSAGGGLYQGGGSVTVKNCRFLGNSVSSGIAPALGGGAAFAGGGSSVTNCLFVGNSAHCQNDNLTEGGGLFTNSASVITNSTFTRNDVSARASALAQGGGLFNSASSPTVTNCIFSGNTAPNADYKELCASSSTALSVSYSTVEGGIPLGVTDGGHNINADPLFVRASSPGSDNEWGTADDDYGDQHLQSGSPCINAGTAAAPNLPPCDLQGFVRIAGSVPDMGAYEFGSTFYVSVDLYVDKASGNDIIGDGMPATPFQTVAKALNSIPSPLGFARIHIKADNYGSDKPRVMGRVRFVNWNNVGQARIGKP